MVVSQPISNPLSFGPCPSRESGGYWIARSSRAMTVKGETAELKRSTPQSIHTNERACCFRSPFKITVIARLDRAIQ
jgi:hypothetical protein